MLGPSDGITDCSGLIRAGRPNECVCHLVKQARRDAADLLHHLRGVTGKMPLQLLKHATWMLQRKIALRETESVAFVKPTFRIVGSLFFVPAGEKAGGS